MQIVNIWRISVTVLKRKAISGRKKSRWENIKVDDNDNLCRCGLDSSTSRQIPAVEVCDRDNGLADSKTVVKILKKLKNIHYSKYTQILSERKSSVQSLVITLS